MIKKPKISIIIPVFNVEKYLEKCLESIIAQSLKEIEIILVNDGSTDQSYAICKKYQAIDERIIVLDKKNGGLSDTRNYGLQYATADWIGFVDSDDYVDRDFYEKLYCACVNGKVDIAVAGIKKVDNSGKVLYKSGYIHEGIVSNSDAMKSMLNARGISNSVCNKLFKKSLFSCEPFPVGRLYEDEYVTYRIVDKCINIYYLDSTYYYYRENPKSITHKRFSKQELDRIEASLYRLDYLKKNHQELVNDGKRYLMYDCLTTLSKMEKYKTKYNNIILNNIRKCLWAYLKGKSALGAKGFAVIAAISPSVGIMLFNNLKKALSNDLSES